MREDDPSTPQNAAPSMTASSGAAGTPDAWREAAEELRRLRAETGQDTGDGKGKGRSKGSGGIQQSGEDGNNHGGNSKHYPKVTFKEFSGDVHTYKEWKREIELQTLLHDLEDFRVAALLYLALTPGPGKPRDLFTNWNVPHDLQEGGALKDMWKILEAEYLKADYTLIG